MLTHQATNTQSGVKTADKTSGVTLILQAGAESAASAELVSNNPNAAAATFAGRLQRNDG